MEVTSNGDLEKKCWVGRGGGCWMCSDAWSWLCVTRLIPRGGHAVASGERVLVYLL